MYNTNNSEKTVIERSNYKLKLQRVVKWCEYDRDAYNEWAQECDLNFN